MNQSKILITLGVVFLLGGVSFGTTLAKERSPKGLLQNFPSCKKDPKGCAVIMPKGSIVMGTLLDLTGPASSGGIPDTQSVQMALEDAGKWNGHSLAIMSRSDTCNTDTDLLRSGAQELVDQSNLIGILGTTCSGAAKEVNDITGDAGVTMFSPSNTNVSLTEPPALVFYARAFNDNAQAGFDAGYVFNELHKTKAVVVEDSSSLYSTGLGEVFASDFKGLGGQILDTQSIDCTSSDCGSPSTFTAMVDAIAANGIPEVLFIPFNGAPEAVGFIEEVRGRQAFDNTVLMGGDSLDDVAIGQAGEAAEGVLASGPPALPQAFIDKYEARFCPASDRDPNTQQCNCSVEGHCPSAFSGIAYDETNILLRAAKSVTLSFGDKKGNSIMLTPRSALYQALLATHGYTGVMGPDNVYDCSANGANVGDCLNDAKLTINQFQKGTFVQVFP